MLAQIEDRPIPHQSPVPTLTHSASTDSSDKGSAFELGGASAAKWERATKRNHCDLRELTQEVTELDTFLRQVNYPLAIKDEEFVQYVTELEDERDVRLGIARPSLRYRWWLSRLRDNQFEEDDPYGIGFWRSALFLQWDQYSSANYWPTETVHKVRVGVDSLVGLAFENRKKAKHFCRFERDLFLPSSPWTTTADVIALMKLPSDWIDFLLNLENRHVFASEDLPMAVVTFACEARTPVDALAASRHLTLDLCSAQHQRRALGFEDGNVFGATLVRHEFSIFVSEWSHGNVVVKPTGIKFYLNAFQEFLDCYIFLCKLADFAAEEVDKVYRKWATAEGRQDLQQKNRGAIHHPWRLRERPNPREASSNKRPHLNNEETREDVGSQNTDDKETFEELFEGWPVMITAEGEGPIPPGGDPLVEENLHVHDKYLLADTRTTDITPVKGIRGWARQSSEECIDASEADFARKMPQNVT